MRYEKWDREATASKNNASSGKVMARDDWLVP